MKIRPLIILFAIAVGFTVLAVQRLPDVASPEAMGGSCMLNMNRILVYELGEVYNFQGVTTFDEPELYYLAVYDVEGDTIQNPVFEDVPDELMDEQTDSALQKEAWDVFSTVIPAQDRQMVSQLNVFTDGFENTLAAVDQSKQDMSKWFLEVDIADLEDRNELILTLVHEYAHLLTLNDTQVTPDPDLLNDPFNQDLQIERAAQCPNYFVGNGCSLPNSYINLFYNRFWQDVKEEWNEVDALQYGTSDFLPYYNALYQFYLDHQDQFVSDYAVTHPAEDIAEVFTHFVFNPKPMGNSIKDQKILFFYEYPNLVQLRSDILNGSCKLAER